MKLSYWEYLHGVVEVFDFFDFTYIPFNNTTAFRIVSLASTLGHH